VLNAIATCCKLNPSQSIDKSIEYGPGLGVYLPKLSAVSTYVYAADINSDYLNEITCRIDTSNIQCIEDDICASPFDDDFFDLILCSEVLEHLSETENAINTLFRTLKRGQFCIVTTPQKYSLLELCAKIAFLPGIIEIVRLVYGEPIKDMGHINLKTNTQLCIALKKAGFEILEETKFGMYLPALAEFGFDGVLQSIEKFLLGRKLDFLLWTQAFILKKP